MHGDYRTGTLIHSRLHGLGRNQSIIEHFHRNRTQTCAHYGLHSGYECMSRHNNFSIFRPTIHFLLG